MLIIPLKKIFAFAFLILFFILSTVLISKATAESTKTNAKELKANVYQPEFDHQIYFERFPGSDSKQVRDLMPGMKPAKPAPMVWYEKEYDAPARVWKSAGLEKFVKKMTFRQKDHLLIYLDVKTVEAIQKKYPKITEKQISKAKNEIESIKKFQKMADIEVNE